MSATTRARDERYAHGGNLDATIRAVDLDDLRELMDQMTRGDGSMRRLEIDARYCAREESEDKWQIG